MEDNNLAQLAEEALRLDIRAKEITELAKEAKDRLKAAAEAEGLLNGDTKAIGNVRTIIKPNRRFDEKLALDALTPEEIDKYSTLKLDPALLKRNYSPDVYENLFMKDNGFSVTLAPLED